MRGDWRDLLWDLVGSRPHLGSYPLRRGICLRDPGSDVLPPSGDADGGTLRTRRRKRADGEGAREAIGAITGGHAAAEGWHVDGDGVGGDF